MDDAWVVRFCDDTDTPYDAPVRARAALPQSRLLDQEYMAELEAMPKDTRLAFICHTGNRSCFYVRWEDNRWVEHSNPLFDPDEVYKKK